MPQFFVSPDSLSDPIIHIRGKEARHMRDVLRLDVGDWVVLCDGRGQRYRANITDSRPLHVTLQRGESLPELKLAHQVTLAAAIIRPQRFDWLVEKAFELGCHRLVPLLTERTVDHYVKDTTKQQARWSEIALSAAKQSGLPWLPQVIPPVELAHILKAHDGDLVYCWEGLALDDTANVAPQKKMSHNLTILIGPEGGFSQSEHAAILAQSPQLLSLGSLILRSETAALAALVKVMI
ncbi:MAG: hypothetical protein COV45_05655 [Deltaproteobacteria bacterium CG11_big_fil_rev_8_21_14_0_20_47_16]|nr:MAG: hypothetical protein COV45_05655 [Deltaproteobacteria bacterium CG11_big_fil_rev_8_21_14_0_20_47_16]